MSAPTAGATVTTAVATFGLGAAATGVDVTRITIAPSVMKKYDTGVAKIIYGSYD